jgi:CheY-like chemotaxis protein
MSDPGPSKVLYVEDEENIRTVGLFSLTEVGGLTVEPACGGHEALAKVAGFGPDLILMDVMMPGMDGIATFKALRERADTAQIPVIFMTAKVQPNEVEEYLRMGAVAVIAKPFDPVALPDEVRAIWADRVGACAARSA